VHEKLWFYKNTSVATKLRDRKLRFVSMPVLITLHWLIFKL